MQPIAIDVPSHSVEQTEQIGAALGPLLAGGELVCLEGDLGAGKTAFVRGLGCGWGAQERVTSPTFTLVHEHTRAQNRHVLYHVDCYRLERPEDAWSIGLEDMLYGGGAVVIEWPERVVNLLPEQRLWIAFVMVGDDERLLRMTATGEPYERLLRALREQVGA